MTLHKLCQGSVFILSFFCLAFASKTEETEGGQSIRAQPTEEVAKLQSPEFLVLAELLKVTNHQILFASPSAYYESWTLELAALEKIKWKQVLFFLRPPFFNFTVQWYAFSHWIKNIENTRAICCNKRPKGHLFSPFLIFPHANSLCCSLSK